MLVVLYVICGVCFFSCSSIVSVLVDLWLLLMMMMCSGVFVGCLGMVGVGGVVCLVCIVCVIGS